MKTYRCRFCRKIFGTGRQSTNHAVRGCDARLEANSRRFPDLPHTGFGGPGGSGPFLAEIEGDIDPDEDP